MKVKRCREDLSRLAKKLESKNLGVIGLVVNVDEKERKPV